MSIRTGQHWPALAGRFARFGRGECGSATVEAVLWLPVFVGALCLVADFSMIFNGETLATRVVEDANRKYSVNWFTDTDQVETAVKSALVSLSPNATVQSSDDGVTVTTRVLLDTDDLVATGWFDFLTGRSVAVQSSQMLEK